MIYLAKFKPDKKTFKKIVSELQKELKKELPDLIVEQSIKKGISPVFGFRKFPKYSEIYKAIIKRTRIKGGKRSPVTLTLTGDMNNSFKVKKIKDGLNLSFTDEKSQWHNDGEGNLPQRKMLPTETKEKFSRVITMRIKELIIKTVTKYGK